jgi:hypothetical protein
VRKTKGKTTGRGQAFLSTLLIALSLVALLLLSPSLAAGPPREGPPVAAQPREPASVSAVSQWDSGWGGLPAGFCRTMYHNLGVDPDDPEVVYAVDLWFRDTDGNYGINRRGYGGLGVGGAEPHEGAYWKNLEDDSIMVCRGAGDPAAGQVRVRVWIPDTTDAYVSPWTAIEPDRTRSFRHGLTAPVEELAVGLMFRGNKGIHHLGYGGLFVDSTLQEPRGAFWLNLTGTSVEVTRLQYDIEVDWVRVVVVRADPPDYDSGWQTLSLGENVFPHNLGWNPGAMLVRSECRSDLQAAGIHHIFAGGIDVDGSLQGTHMEQLKTDSLVVERWPDDQMCPEYRVRIWKLAVSVHVPLVLRNE